MILFEKDWGHYPQAIVHGSTTNTSFVRLCKVYEKMGVKNNAFPLALLDRELLRIDPFSTDLSEEECLRVAAECAMNPWYFMREILRAPAASGSDAVPVQANRANIALWWSFLNHITFFLIQPRQTGKSFNTDGLMTWLKRARCRNTLINLLTKDDTLRRENVQRLKDIVDELPTYLQLKQKDDVANGEEISVNALGNRYITHVQQSSEKRANNLGRGITSPIIHVDEPPFQAHIGVAIQAMLAATGAAVDRAKAAGAPYGVIFTTTAGKRDDPSGAYVYKLLQNSAQWTEAFYDARDEADLRKLVTTACPGNNYRIDGTFNHRQLGKSDEWLREKIKENMQEGASAERDYFNIWTSGNARSPFSKEITDKINGSLCDEECSVVDPQNSYLMRWYYSPDEIDRRMGEEHHLIGIDSSNASGGDDIGVVITSIRTMSTVAVANVNETNLISFAQWLTRFLVKYKNSTCIIENRSSGTAIIDYLTLMLPEHGEDPFKRLYSRVVDDSDEYPDRYREIKQPMGRRDKALTVRYKKLFGFTTSGGGAHARSELYGLNMTNALKRSGGRVKDQKLIKQLMGLVIKNNRIDHEDGSHDDLVIAYLLTHWLVQHGKNLSHYGIPVNEIYSEVGATAQHQDPVEAMRMAEQAEIRGRLLQVSEMLSSTRDENIVAMLEHELRQLDRRVQHGRDEVMSVEELIKKARDGRRLHKVTARSASHTGWATGRAYYR